MDPETTKNEVTAAMSKAVEHMLHEFTGVRTGKASPSLVENPVSYTHLTLPTKA